MASEVSDEARRLFGVVGYECDDIMERMPGWLGPHDSWGWYRGQDGELVIVTDPEVQDAEILAAAFRCAESLAKQAIDRHDASESVKVTLAIAEGPKPSSAGT